MSFNDLYPSIFHINLLSVQANKNHWSHLPRCNLQSVIRNHAAWSAPAIPPSRAPINSPAAAPACRCAFKVNRVSRYAPLSWSRSIHRAFLSPSHFTQLAAAARDFPHVLLGPSTRRTRNDTFEMIENERVPATARPGLTERLRRTGAAPALRVYRRLKACISLPAGRDGPRRGGTGWENLTRNHGDRSRHYTQARSCAECRSSRRVRELPECHASRRGYRDDTFEWLKRHSLEI